MPRRIIINKRRKTNGSAGVTRELVKSSAAVSAVGGSAVSDNFDNEFMESF